VGAGDVARERERWTYILLGSCKLDYTFLDRAASESQHGAVEKGVNEGYWRREIQSKVA
jgi:hypothetical protein